MDGTGSTSRILVTFAAFIVIVAGMKAAATIVVPVLFALFLAVICSSPVSWLVGKGVSAWLAILVVMLVIIAVSSFVTGFLGASVTDFVRASPRYATALEQRFSGIYRWLDGHGVDTDNIDILGKVDASMVMGYTAMVLNSLKDVLANGFLIIVTAVFMLLEASSFPKKLGEILDDSDGSMPQFEKITNEIKRYLALKTWICLSTGIVATVLLIATGVDNPFLWGSLTFLLNYIPTIGSFIAAIPPILLAFVQYGFTKAIIVAIGYVVLNLVIGNLVEPRVMGKGLGLSTLVVFLSLLFWGWVFGPVGMILSVPLTMMTKIVLESREDTKWIAIILGSPK
ncbi:MAG: AI-2E family transporter [Candidatus Krumholzibacteria bacterium]|nr:AI-2E family transporter [Candidatus Krumholzibacteria bacterium]